MLERLDGLPVGPAPAQGVFQENVFLHSEMGFAIDFPPEWDTANTASVVGAYEPEKRAQLFLGLAEGEPADLAAAFVRLDVLALMNGLAADATPAEGQTIRIGRREPYRSRR